MLTTYYRAANDFDLQASRRDRGSLLHNLTTISLPASAVAFVMVYGIWRSFSIASAGAVSLFAASFWSNLSFFRGLRNYARLKEDGRAIEVFEANAEYVLDLEAVGDDAPALCFFVGERKALLLVGQWLLDYESFPALRFRLHRWRQSQQHIRIEVLGPPIEPESSRVRMRSSYRYRKLQLIEAARDTLQEDLDRALGV